jgi:hypothetical protein
LSSHFDHVFWMGDLNYRLDLNAAASAGDASASEGTRESANTAIAPATPYPAPTAHHAAVCECIAACRAGTAEWRCLDDADQLLNSQRAGEAFVGYTEAAHTFAPTFKVTREVGTAYKNQRSTCATDPTRGGPPTAVALLLRRLRMILVSLWATHSPVVVRPCPRQVDAVALSPRPPQILSRYRGGAPLMHELASSPPHLSPLHPVGRASLLHSRARPLSAADVARCLLGSSPKVSTSDHKPVLAEFTLTLTDTLFGSSLGRRGTPKTLPALKSKKPIVLEKAPVGVPANKQSGFLQRVRLKAANVARAAIRGRRVGTSGPAHIDVEAPLVRTHSLELIDLQSGDVGGGSDPCT